MILKYSVEKGYNDMALKLLALNSLSLIQINPVIKYTIIIKNINFNIY